jgi:hypothetical protein
MKHDAGDGFHPLSVAGNDCGHARVRASLRRGGEVVRGGQLRDEGFSPVFSGDATR